MLAIEVDTSLPALRVVRVLDKLRLQSGLPVRIVIDHGTEFTSKALDQWAYAHGVQLDFSRPGKPTDNALIESFNGRLRAECLNENWFLSLEDAGEKIEAWRTDCDERRILALLGIWVPRNSVQVTRLA